MRHKRVALVFGIVIVVSVVLPVPAQSWLQSGEAVRLRLLESAWLTHSVQLVAGEKLMQIEPPPRRTSDPKPPSCTPIEGPLLDLDAIAADRRIAWVGQASTERVSWVLGQDAAVAYHPFDPSMPALPAGPPRRPAGMDALRFLRLHRGQMDVIFLSLEGLARPVREDLLAANLTRRARGSLKPEGVVVLLLPTDASEPAEWQRWKDQVARHHDAPYLSHCLANADRRVSLLVFGHGDRWMARWSRWSTFSTVSPPHGTQTAHPR
jgi:hypothetical protein